ncbi:Zn(II)2Cys6 transcription factor [Aspergillus stella-maris]|uniref:Zn(II)2Cys6 transcription factor n=1 Tax=Aspergillus stella-maris TaxID=1810926 RepID=UPI003CCC93D1
MDEARPAKRTRQACEQCRRKKSRCPGERPACSYCQRLGQLCEYAGDEEPDYARKMEQRIDGIEGKLDALIGTLSEQRGSATWLTSEPSRLEPSTELDVTPVVLEMPYRRNESNAQTALQLFYTYCNYQPLPLFHHKSFQATAGYRDPELLLAIQALGLRFNGNGIADPDIEQQIQEWTERSRRMVMARVTEGSVELSTLQALCILIFIDHAKGNSLKAGANYRLATYLLENLQFGNVEPSNLEDERDERILLRWTLHMLGSLIGEAPRRLAHSIHSRLTNREDLGLTICAIQLAEVWGLAQGYAAAPVTADSPPPWAPQSDYSRITFRHTEYESITPLRYRHHETRLDESSTMDLQQRRDFWGHCLFFQLAFHAVPCLLNHPLLLSTRLRNFRHTMPQSFLRHSYEQITLHAGWVLHFIDLLDAKNYEVSDPTLGQCVVIVATIYLQHSFVEDMFSREKAEAGYDKCLGFLKRMALRWPSIARQVDNLDKLRTSITPGGVQNQRQAWSINVQLLRDILISAPPKQTARAIFGPVLAAACAQDTNSSTPDPDFQLIGSAGISGHKTVARNLATYYPPGQVLQPTPPDLSALLGEPGTGLAGTANNAFFQPQDYGRFIDNWLDLPV